MRERVRSSKVQSAEEFSGVREADVEHREQEQSQPGELSHEMSRIVKRALDIDSEAAFERILAGLRRQRSPMHKLEYGELVDLLDSASELTLEAHRLAAKTAVTLARYESDLAVLQSDMRAKAVALISFERSQKDAAGKSKTITEADVESRMAASFPDEYRRQSELLAETKAVAKLIQSLPGQWADRRKELDGMVRTVRKG